MLRVDCEVWTRPVTTAEGPYIVSQSYRGHGDWQNSCRTMHHQIRVSWERQGNLGLPRKQQMRGDQSGH